MKKLENKTVFITGGLSGIGKACAIAAAHEGANVVIADFRTDLLTETMDELTAINPRAIFVECDVSENSQVEAAIHRTVRVFATIDVALNNAGIFGEVNNVADMTEHAWHKVINVNLNGVFYCMKHELTQMAIQKHGVIVNVSSVLGKVGFAGSCHYVATKHAVIGLTQTAALEYAAHGIRVNAICPGFTETPLLTGAGIVENSDRQNDIISHHAMHRLGKSKEIAPGFIYLASDDSLFVTGTTLEIDGGFLIH